MARRRRSDIHHPMLHVYTRGSDRQDIFYSDDDRQHLIDRLAESVESFDIEVHSYCLMQNHIHLQIDRSHGDISAAMQFVLGRHARHINSGIERSGPLFTSRFRCEEVTSDEQAMQLSRYTSRNPLAFVDLGELDSYPWSSLGAYLGTQEAPPWLRTDLILGIHNHTVASYREFIFRPQPTDKPDGRQASAWLCPSLDDIDTAIVIATNEDPRLLRAPKRGRTDSLRDLAALLALELRVGDTRSIASHYGFDSLSGLRRSAQRARAKSARDPAFALLANQIRTLSQPA